MRTATATSTLPTPPAVAADPRLFADGPIAGRLARAALWSVGAAALSRGLNLAANVLVARVLGAAAFGELGVVSTTAALFLSLGGMGMTLAVTQQVARHRTVDHAKAGQLISLALLTSAAFGVLTGAGLFLFADGLAAAVLREPKLAGALRLAGLWVAFGTAAATQAGVLSGLEEFRALALLNSARAAVASVVLAAGALSHGVTGAVFASALAELGGLVLGAVMVRRACVRQGIPRGRVQSWTLAGPLLRVGLLGLLGSAATMPALWLTRLWLIRTPGGYLEAGFYEAANKWALAILFLPGAMGGVLLPILSNLDGTGDHQSHARVFKLNLAVTVALCAVPACVVAALSRQLMGLSGPQFVAAAPALVVLSLASVPVALNTALGQALVSKGRLRLRLGADWALALVLAAVSYLLASRGALGIALASALAYSVVVGVLLTYPRLDRRRAALSP